MVHAIRKCFLEYRKVRHREGSPQEGLPQNWKVRHSFRRFATNVIGKFATTLECKIKQVTNCLLKIKIYLFH